MSEQDAVARVEPWVKVAGWLKGLFVGGFLFSGWVTGLQFQVAETAAEVRRLQEKDREDDLRLSALREIALETRGDVKWIKESLAK